MISAHEDDINYSIVNSTKIPLGSNQSFVGTGQLVEYFIQVIINIASDQPSDTDGVILEFSPDNSTWTSNAIFNTRLDSVTNIYNLSLSYYIKDKYFRIRYINGGTPQNFIQLQTIFKKYRNPDGLSTATSPIDQHETTAMTRLASDFKRDIALGLVPYANNFVVNGTRTQGVGNTETLIGSISNTLYQFPTTPRRLRVKAGGNVNDTFGGAGANIIAIIGLDQDFNELTETIMLNGVNESSWSTNTFIRVNRSVVVIVGTYGSTNYGNIIIESETDLYELSTISTNTGRSLDMVYTVPKGKNAVMPRLSFIVDSLHSVTFKGYYRENTGTFNPPYKPTYLVNYINGVTGSWDTKPEEFFVLNEMTDIWGTAETITGTGNSHISASIDINLINNF